MDPTTRQSILKSLSTTKEIPVSTGAKLLDVNRTSIYYVPVGISEEELSCKAIIDRLHTDNPAWGARQMSAQLKRRGYNVGRKKARRYMTDMAIDPIYPKMNLSKRAHNAHIKPYLLKNAVITRPNQAWSIDITYIPIERGFLYLTAIIDWYSRCIVGWEVDDTLDTRMVMNALKKALKVATPEIINSDCAKEKTMPKNPISVRFFSACILFFGIVFRVNCQSSEKIAFLMSAFFHNFSSSSTFGADLFMASLIISSVANA